MRGPCFAKDVHALIRRARLEAVRLGSAETGTEHLLLAIAASETPAGAFLRDRGVTPDRVEHYSDPLNVDAPLLAMLGIDVAAVQQHLDGNFGQDAWRRVFGSRQKRFTPEAGRTLRRAVRFARSTRRRSIDATIVLLAVLGEGRQAGLVLRRLGQDPEDLERLLFNAA